MVGENFCYNCFQQRETSDGPCPHCGFDLVENEKKYPVALRAGTVLNGRYIVGRVLGQGGFGITYLAWDTQLEAKVAIKEFMPNEIATRIGTTVSVAVESRSEDFTYGSERFQEEARTLAKFIGNPNIAAVTSYFDENDTSYFVMDYIEGISFKTYIANHGGKVSVEDTLNVMIPVLRALTAVHQEGFIHRDVTPDNIYITKDGMVKLLDFGSARYSIGDKSKSLDVILKVGYAPKEQYIRRSRQGPYTDVYSCAACFYAALTGFLPPEALERLDHDELVPVSQCGVDIPEYLDKAILKGLAVQPEDRFQSAEEFLNAIESQQVVEVPQAGSAQPAVPAKKKLSPVLIGGVAAAVIGSPMGILFADESGDPNSIRIAEIVAETNADFGTAINDIVSAHPECSETTMEYDYEDGHTWASYWPEVLAVFAVQNNQNNDGDVVVIDEGKKRLIQDTFWAMHEISAEVKEVAATPEPTEDEPDPEPVTEYILHITVSSKSVDALADLYRFTQDQRDILHQLLSEEMRPSLLALCGGIAVADGELCWPLPGHTYREMERYF